MRNFPNVLPNVVPLYTPPVSPIINYYPNAKNRQQNSTNTTEQIRKRTQNSTEPFRETNNNDSCIKKSNYLHQIVQQTKMYEPVSDGCVTIINPSKYDNRRTYDQSDVEEDCTSIVSDQLSQQPQSQSQPTPPAPPPDKPPRRIKIQKQLKKQVTSQNNDCILLNRKNCEEKMRTGNGDNYIDVDHITLETERNYKNRFHSIGIQTSHLLPYRLRFWPKLNSDIKCDPSGNSSFKDKLRCCGRTLSQWFFSQIGLTIILINWALLGAAAFYNTEGPRELQQSEDLESLQKDLAIDLATALRQVSEYSQVWPQTIYKYMAQHETLLLKAVSAGYGEGGGGSIWTYPGCILFAVSLLTTLGFGAPVPRTALGRGAAVLFSAIGIPLHFLLILNIGNLAAGKLQLLFMRGSESTIPIHTETTTLHSRMLKWFPFLSILFYYSIGAILFGFVRQRCVVDSLMFPLDFTAAGGVAKTSGHVRIFYALYLEVAVILAATIVSLLQASATRGVVDLGLRLGLLTNT